MPSELARRVVEPFVPEVLRREPERRRVALSLVSAAFAAALLVSLLAISRFVVEGGRSAIGSILGAAAVAFATVPFVVRKTASVSAGARLALAVGVALAAGMGWIEGGLRSEAFLWVPLVPVAAALVRGERAVAWWALLSIATVAVIGARELPGTDPSRLGHLTLYSVAGVGAVLFGAVLGRTFESGREKAARELESRERRWRALVEGMPDALLRIDADNCIVDVHVPSQPFSMSLVPHALLGRSIVSALPGHIGARVLELASEARAAGAVVRDESFSLAQAQLQVIVVQLPEGDTLAILRDVSALAAAERERAISDERADLLADLVKQRDEFLSVASHELRTPLTAMKLWVDRVNRLPPKEREQVPPRVLEAHTKIAVQVGRLETLVDELLDVSRLLEDRLQLEVAPVRLDEVVREVVGRFEIEAKRLACPIELDLEAIEGRWDRSRLDQIATNLVSNALKYGAGRPIEVHVRAREGEACLSVRDHGIGIAAADQARIFERFERLPTTRAYWGLGLGLWITRRLVLAMAGRIEMKSSPGEGSTFIVVLPVAPPASQDALRKAG